MYIYIYIIYVNVYMENEDNFDADDSVSRSEICEDRYQHGGRM